MIQTSVVVVEDESLIAYDVQLALEGLGYRVPATAASLEEALAAVDLHRPDVVLMDIRIEGKRDGIEAAGLIHRGYGIPVVFLTSHSDPKTIQRAKGASPYGYLLKPFTERELQVTLEIALERRAAEKKLAEKTALLEGVLSSMQDAVIARDPRGHVLLFNAAAVEMLGREPVDGIEHLAAAEGLYLADEKTLVPTEDIPMVRALAGDTVRNAEMLVRSTGRPEGRWHSVTAAPLQAPNGHLLGAVVVARDITEVRKMQTELRTLSETDPLTGAHNRRAFLRLATRELELAARHAASPALFFIDLDGLKEINDQLGHKSGDRALLDATAVLKHCFRGSDVVARLGGDEFAVLTPDVGRPENAATLRSRLLAAVDDFNGDSRREYRLSMSVGVLVVDPENVGTVEALLEEADARMYAEKTRRRTERSLAPGNSGAIVTRRP